MEMQYSINKIAQALNLSRNTVSKVINKKGGVSAKTTKIIENFLQEHPADESPDVSGRTQKTILFSYRLENVEYINSLLAGIEKTVKKCGYLLALNIIHEPDSKPVPLPDSFFNGSVHGIISFNIYDPDYWEQVCALPLPSVFIDTLADRNLFAGKTDIVMPENEVFIHELVQIMAAAGRRNLGYFGDPSYCYSLRQRWLAFQKGLDKLGLPLKMENCILDDFGTMSDLDMIEVIRDRLQKMETIADAYICASDRQAILLLRALKSLALRVPEDVAVSGADNLPECLRLSPPLTTVENNASYQGEIAVRKILERLEDPHKPHEFILVEGNVILRGTIPIS